MPLTIAELQSHYRDVLAGNVRWWQLEFPKKTQRVLDQLATRGVARSGLLTQAMTELAVSELRARNDMAIRELKRIVQETGSTFSAGTAERTLGPQQSEKRSTSDKRRESLSPRPRERENVLGDQPGREHDRRPWHSCDQRNRSDPRRRPQGRDGESGGAPSERPIQGRVSGSLGRFARVRNTEAAPKGSRRGEPLS